MTLDLSLLPLFFPGDSGRPWTGHELDLYRTPHTMVENAIQDGGELTRRQMEVYQRAAVSARALLWQTNPPIYGYVNHEPMGLMEYRDIEIQNALLMRTEHAFEWHPTNFSTVEEFCQFMDLNISVRINFDT